jgi:hypothetical protein
MMNKKHLALLLLLCFGISLGCAIKYYPRQQRLPSSATREPRRTNRPANHATVAADPQSSSLAKESSGYAGYHTDLFRPLFDGPPPDPEIPVALPMAPPLPPVSVEPVNPPELPVARNLAGFTYLGQMTDGEKHSIFLKEKTRIFVVDTGEAFGEKLEFRLVQVTEKEIRIATGEGDDLIRIPLQKKKPLVADNLALPLARTARKYPVPPLPDPPKGETL